MKMKVQRILTQRSYCIAYLFRLQSHRERKKNESAKIYVLIDFSFDITHTHTNCFWMREKSVQIRSLHYNVYQ